MERKNVEWNTIFLKELISTFWEGFIYLDQHGEKLKTPVAPKTVSSTGRMKMTRTTKPKSSKLTCIDKQQIELADILREHIVAYQREYPLLRTVCP